MYTRLKRATKFRPNPRRRRTAYLAGPMTGIDEFNFPEFNRAAAYLRYLGISVFNPAEHETINISEEEWSALAIGEQTRNAFMHVDLQAVLDADMVIVLPEWEQSRGARAELFVAFETGTPIFQLSGTVFTQVDTKMVAETA